MLASHTLLHSPGSAPDQAVSLERLVILYMLGKLTERVGPCGAFRATEERHDRSCDERTC